MIFHIALIFFYRMGDANTKEEFWKRLFNLLFNNKEPDDLLPNMWAQFKAENLHRSDLRTAIESLKDNLHEDVRKKLCDINSEGNVDEDSLLALLVKYQLPNKVIDKLCDLSIGGKSAEAGIWPP